jgi:APA family basic amino acid/polyamine antiporter
VGAVIGAGIFVTTGAIARQTTGPALMLSYVVAGTVCVFAALCYAEFASMVPVAGSAYTYAYATLGELFAWIIGWDLVLEYAVGSATVANGWSSYFQSVLGTLGYELPKALNGPVIVYDPKIGHLVATGSIINLPALLVVAAVTVVLVVGIRESAGFNAAMVMIKVAAVLFVIGVGAFYVNTANWHPFAPYGYTGVSFFGKTLAGQVDAGGQPLGMLAGAALAFFAYIGFDSISTHAEEARRPNRDVPIAIVAALLICTVLYVAVVAVLTGMVPYDKLDINAPVATAFAQVGLGWAKLLIALAGAAGITSVLLVMMLSQPRVLLAMARDGMLPPSFFGAVHERFRTPWKSTIATGFFRRGHGRLPAHHRPAQPRQHGDAPGLRHRLRGGPDHAPHPPRGGAALPLSPGAGGPHPGHPELPAPDVQPARGELDPAGRLAGHRPRDLLQLQPAAQRDGPAARPGERLAAPPSARG